MNRSIFSLAVCLWCAVILGALVTASCLGNPAMCAGSLATTVAALFLAVGVTSDLRQP